MLLKHSANRLAGSFSAQIRNVAEAQTAVHNMEK